MDKESIISDALKRIISYKNDYKLTAEKRERLMRLALENLFLAGQITQTHKIKDIIGKIK